MNATADGVTFPRFDNSFTMTPGLQNSQNNGGSLVKRRYNHSAEKHSVVKGRSPMVPAIEAISKLSKQVGDMNRTAQYGGNQRNAFNMHNTLDGRKPQSKHSYLTSPKAQGVGLINRNLVNHQEKYKVEISSQPKKPYLTVEEASRLANIDYQKNTEDFNF